MAAWGAIGRGLGKGAKWGAAGAIGGGLGLGVNPLLGLAVGNAIRNMKGFGKRDTTITAGEKPHPESKKNPKVKGDLSKTVDFQTAILQIDKTTRATYLQTLKNNHEIIHIQKMMAGPTAARAKELRMESSVGGAPIIINNIMGGGEKKDEGFPWWIPFLIGGVATAVLDPILGKLNRRPKITLDDRFKGLDKKLGALEDRLKKLFGDRATDYRNRLLEERGRGTKGIGNRFTALEELFRSQEKRLERLFGERATDYRNRLLEERGRPRGITEGRIALLEDRLRNLYGERTTDFRNQLIEERGRTPRSVFERMEIRISEQLRLLGEDLRPKTPAGRGTGQGYLWERIETIRQAVETKGTDRATIGKHISTIAEEMKRLGKQPTGRGSGVWMALDNISRDMKVMFEALTGERTPTTTNRARLPLRIGRNFMDRWLTRFHAQRALNEVWMEQRFDAAELDRRQWGRRVLSGLGEKVGKVFGSGRTSGAVPPTVKIPSTTGQGQPWRRLGVDAKPVSPGAVPYTAAELEKLNRADAARITAEGERIQADRIQESKFRSITERLKGMLRPIKLKLFGKTTSINPNSVTTRALAWVAKTHARGGAVTALGPRAAKLAFWGMVALLGVVSIFELLDWFLGGTKYLQATGNVQTPQNYSPWLPAARKQRNTEFMKLGGMLVVAGVAWVAIDQILRLLFGVMAGFISAATGPFAPFVAFGLNFFLAGAVAHKLTPHILHWIAPERFPKDPGGFEGGTLNEAQQRAAILANMSERRGATSDTMVAILEQAGVDTSTMVDESGRLPLYSEQNQLAAKMETAAQNKQLATSIKAKGSWGSNILGFFISDAGAASDVPSAVASQTYSSLGDMIMSGESAQKGYDDFRKGPNWNDVQHKRAFQQISRLNINVILDAQEAGVLAAVGKYQIIHSTLLMALGAGALGDNKRRAKRQKFNKTNQDKLFRWLLLSKRPAIKRYMNNQGSLIGAQIALAKEWASVAMPVDYAVYDNGKYVRTAKKGESYYAHLGNIAHIKADDAALQLSQARQQALAQSGGTDTNAAGSNGATIVNYTDYGDNFTTQATTNFHPWKSHLGIPNQTIAY